MLFKCWASVEDGGPTFKQYWVNASCLLGRRSAWFVYFLNFVCLLACLLACCLPFLLACLVSNNVCKVRTRILGELDHARWINIGPTSGWYLADTGEMTYYSRHVQDLLCCRAKSKGSNSSSPLLPLHGGNPTCEVHVHRPNAGAMVAQSLRHWSNGFVRGWMPRRAVVLKKTSLVTLN